MNKILGWITAISAFLAILFRGNAYKSEARRQEERAESANMAIEIRDQIDEDKRELNKKHKQENKDAQAKHDASRRDHLNNRW